MTWCDNSFKETLFSVPWISIWEDVANSFNRFQKDSPYLEDMNILIGMANQMGLVHGIFDKAVYNATKCKTWQSIEASHMAFGHTVVLKLDDIYGILSL